MPILFKEQNELYGLCIWEIREKEEYFESLSSYTPDASHAKIRIQKMASRASLLSLGLDVSTNDVKINTSGKPFLRGSNIKFNLTHTNDFAASIISEFCDVGIDMEKVSPRLLKVSKRFLSTKELQLVTSNINENQMISNITKCWAIKEAVYKWWGKGGLDFAGDIKILSFSDDACEVLLDVADSIFLQVNTKLVRDHWLAYLIK